MYQMTWSKSQEGLLSEKSKRWENVYCMMPFCKGTLTSHVCLWVWVWAGLGEMEGNSARSTCNCDGLSEVTMGR